MCGPFRKRLDRKLICISISDTAWSRPPRSDPRGAQEMTLFVEKKIMKMRTKNREGEKGIKLNVNIAKKADWWQVLLHGREQQHMIPLLIHLLPHWDRILKILPKFLWITSALLPKNKLISAVVKADRWLHLYPVHTQIMALVIFWLKKGMFWLSMVHWNRAISNASDCTFSQSESSNKVALISSEGGVLQVFERRRGAVKFSDTRRVRSRDRRYVDTPKWTITSGNSEGSHHQFHCQPNAKRSCSENNKI